MFRAKIWYRGFNPHESGPSYCHNQEYKTWEKAKGVVERYLGQTEIVVLKWEIYETKEELIAYG